MKVEAEGGDVRGAIGPDDQVVALVFADRGQVGVFLEVRAVPDEQAPVEHRDHEESSVGKPAEARGLTGDLDHKVLPIAVEGETHRAERNR